jgi:hypothetical protein
MAIFRRIGLLWGIVIALVWWGSSTVAAAGGTPGGSCASGSVSALNQYCEQIPSAAGGKTPGPGTPAVGNSVPGLTPRAIALSASSSQTSVRPAARKALRALPARTRSRPITGSVADDGIVSHSLPLVLILAAIASVLALVAFVRRRRRHRAA